MANVGVLLALGSVAALAVAGAARSGSRNEPAPAESPLQKRLLFLLKQYPEPIGVRAVEVVASLPGVLSLPGVFIGGRPFTSEYLKPDGWTQLERDFAERADMGTCSTLRGFFEHTVRLGRWYDGSKLADRSGWEPLIPWIGKEARRIVKTLPPIRKVPGPRVANLARGFIAQLGLDELRRLDAYWRDVDDEREAVQATMRPDLRWQQDRLDPAREEVRRGEHRIADIFGKMDALYQHGSHPLERPYRSTGTGLFVTRYPNGVYESDGVTKRPPNADSFRTPEDILISLHLERLIKELPEIRDWVGSGQAGDIGALTYTEATKRAKAWHAAIERAAGGKAGAKKPTTEGTRLFPLSGGWAIQELGEGDLKPQSDAMGHCVGRSDTYRARLRSGDGRILSVRDGLGRAVFTLELSVGKNTPVIENGRLTARYADQILVTQFKGAGNRIPGLSKEKTKVRPTTGNILSETKAWIERARVKFVSMSDVERAVEVITVLSKAYPGIRFGGDLDVVRAVGAMPRFVTGEGKG